MAPDKKDSHSFPDFVYACPFFPLCSRLPYHTSGNHTDFAFEGFYNLDGIHHSRGVGVFAGFLVHEEELAGNFNGFLGTGISRFQLYLGKFSSCWFVLPHAHSWPY